MNIENLYPFAGSHAIQNAVIAVEWQGEVSNQTLMGIYSLASKLKGYFPTAEIQKMVMINIQTQSNIPNTEQIGAINFQRPDNFGGISSQLTISRQNCVLLVNDYSRWDAVLSQALQYFELILPVILPDKSVSAVGLQYTDLFNWKDEPENLNLHEVFRNDCPYLPQNIFDLKTLWHSHHGYIVDSDTPVTHSRLDNLNISILDTAGERSIQIIAAHRANLAKVLRGNTPEYLKTIESVENVLHSVNKDVMRKILTDEVQKKINLG